MQTYTVIWRDDGDDYMFTSVQTCEPPESTTGWVILAAREEYSHWNVIDSEKAIQDLSKSGYDLLAVVRGNLDYVA